MNWQVQKWAFLSVFLCRKRDFRGDCLNFWLFIKKVYILKFSITLYFRISIWIFCNQFIFLVFDGLLQSICFPMFCSKHSITLENTYLISCWFHCVDKLCIKFRFCDTFTVTNFVIRVLLIETLSNFRTIKSCFALYLHMYNVCFRLV